jgi:hypothetical protein
MPVRRPGAADADLRVPGAAAVAKTTSPLPRHPQRPARPTRANQAFAAPRNAQCQRTASTRESATLPRGEPRWRGRVVAQSSRSGWLVCGHSCVEWPPRAGLPARRCGLRHRASESPRRNRARTRRCRPRAPDRHSPLNTRQIGSYIGGNGRRLRNRRCPCPCTRASSAPRPAWRFPAIARSVSCGSWSPAPRCF